MLGPPLWSPNGLGIVARTFSPATQAGLGMVACGVKEKDFYRQEPPTF